jgi:hypothetical protein
MVKAICETEPEKPSMAVTRAPVDEAVASTPPSEEENLAKLARVPLIETRLIERIAFLGGLYLFGD